METWDALAISEKVSISRTLSSNRDALQIHTLRMEKVRAENCVYPLEMRNVQFNQQDICICTYHKVNYRLATLFFCFKLWIVVFFLTQV